MLAWLYATVVGDSLDQGSSTSSRHEPMPWLQELAEYHTHFGPVVATDFLDRRIESTAGVMYFYQHTLTGDTLARQAKRLLHPGVRVPKLRWCDVVGSSTLAQKNQRDNGKHNKQHQHHPKHSNISVVVDEGKAIDDL